MLNLKVKKHTRIYNGLEIIIEIPDKCLLEIRQISVKMIPKEPMNVRTRREKKILRCFTDYIA